MEESDKQAQGLSTSITTTANNSTANGDQNESLANNAGFKATLTVFDLVIYGLIFMVPIAPFAIYAQVYDNSNGMPALAYLIAMVAMLFTALSFGVMVPRFPSSGSIYTFGARGVNTGFGFVTGWLMILQYLLTPDVTFIMAGNAMSSIPGLGSIPLWVWCLLFLAFTTFVSVRGITTTIILDRIALVGELIVFGLFIGFTVAFIIQGHQDAAFTATAFYNPPKFDFGVMFSAVSLCALSYVGFGSVATLTQECKAGPHAPGKAMVIIILILGFLFCLLCYVSTCADPSGQIMASDPTNGFYALAGVVGGEWLMITCEVANVVALGVFTGLAAQTSVSRILYIMGRSGAMPKRLGKMNMKNHTPVTAVLFVAIVSAILLVPLLFIGQATAAECTNFGALSTYCLLNVIVIYHCWIKQREHKFFRHLLFPALGAIFSAIFVFTLSDIPRIAGFIWLIAGVIVYFVATRKFHHRISFDVADEGTPDAANAQAS